ncbi:MAG TPA: serine--tRNA ligase [Candidatus Aerophobetes bacterium]|uniref:Serine--tRNA ligase n=1 Tax=Aerophobetes bacterium TaxID=2030807 RepID=A0A7V5LZQ1_UNCAE|nr:serine--tRNA ligase [Candidatus Aerophobetes bacterium]
MLSPRWVRENIDIVKKSLAKRKVNIDLDGFLLLDEERRKCIKETDKLKSIQNKKSKEIGRLKREGKDVKDLLSEMQEISSKLKALEKKRKEYEEKTREFLLNLPNTLHPDVPRDENQEVKRWGKIPEFDFPVKDHQQLGEELGILDFKAAAKITGSGFVVCRGLGARLERALINFMLDLHIKQGYEEVLPPFMTNTSSTIGTAQLPKFREELYKCEKDDYYLVPTAEVPVTNLHREEILEEKRLPIYYTAYTPCFRREAGAYGKKIQGMIRVHQFNKVELVKFTTPETSYSELEGLLQDAEEVLKKLNLPYRVVKLCGEELGFAASFGYDIEVWLPSQERWLEISTCSNFEDYQARRASIKYREESTGETRYVHTLNGSGLAVGRCVVAILENFQDREGRVRIPEALWPYMDGTRVIEKKG